MGVSSGNQSSHEDVDMKAIYLILSVVGNFQMGSSIKCILNGSPDKLCAPSASGATFCAVRENKDPTKGTQTFCGSGPVGCVEETEGTTCYCNENNCNQNMASAGSQKSEASTGAGGLPGGDGGQASLKVSLVISLVGSILPVILNQLW